MEDREVIDVRSLPIIVATLVLFAAGAGAWTLLGRPTDGHTYSSSATSACIGAESDAVLSPDDYDYVAATATGGYVVARIGPNLVNASFYRSDHDAEDAFRVYRGLGRREGETLYRRSNAVLAWDQTPTDHERLVVDGCLR